MKNESEKKRVVRKRCVIRFYNEQHHADIVAAAKKRRMNLNEWLCMVTARMAAKQLGKKAA